MALVCVRPHLAHDLEIAVWIIVRQRFERLLLPGRIARCMFMRKRKAGKREKSRGEGKEGTGREAVPESLRLPPLLLFDEK